jgi:L-malate glycosyltransferase
MRILHLDAGKTWRGGQIQTATLARGLAARGVEQRLLTRAPGFEDLSSGRWSPLSIVREGRGADLVHAHDGRSHTLAALLCPGVPLVVSRRVAFPVGRGRLDRWKYARAALYLAVSQYVADELRRAGVTQSRIRMIHDGIAPPPDPGSDAVLPESGVVAIRSKDPGKGSALAAEACRLAGLPLRLSDNLERDLPGAGVFLYLSAMEGLGSALILAGFLEKPIVASRVGGIPEIVINSQTGLLTPNDPEAIAATLRRLAADSGLARSLGRAARRQALEKFTDDRMVEQTLDAYQEVLRRVGRAT